MRLSGDLNTRPENVNLEELLASIREEWVKLGPLIDMGPGAPQGSRTEGSSVESKRIERRTTSSAPTQWARDHWNAGKSPCPESAARDHAPSFPPTLMLAPVTV
jgi:hypothetical protein